MEKTLTFAYFYIDTGEQFIGNSVNSFIGISKRISDMLKWQKSEEFLSNRIVLAVRGRIRTKKRIIWILSAWCQRWPWCSFIQMAVSGISARQPGIGGQQM